MKFPAIIPLVIVVFLLSGCMYPEERLSKNNVPNDIQLNMVQEAVENFVSLNQGRVPIETTSNETPIFQKYIIDFNMLVEQNILSSIPGTAFENGGVYKYVLITPDENPRVKLIDLRNTEMLRSVNTKVNFYRSEHVYPPFGQEVENDVYQINYELIGLDSYPHVVSPYSQKNLPIVMDSIGNLYIDYRMDLYEALNEFEHTYKNGDDIRYILPENYPFVPAYSLPYTIENGEPTFMVID